MSPRDYEEELAALLYRQGRFQEAEAAFRLALARRPDSGRLHLSLALCIDPDERPDEALSLFRRAAELDPMLADAHNGIGICEPDLHAAEAAFRQAIVIEPATAEFHANLAFCLLRQERKHDAEPCLRQAVSLDRGNLALMADLGELLLELERFRDAESITRKALRDRGDRLVLLDKRCWAHYERREYDQCERRLRSLRARGGSADEAWLYFIHARALRAQQKTSPAVDALRIAVGLAPRVPEFHDELGRALESLRQPDAAGAAYQRARDLARHAGRPGS